MFMKIRFLKPVVVEVQKSRLDEIWDKSFRKWDVVRVDTIIDNGQSAELVTEEGDTIYDVPREAFEVVKG